jgi:NADH-quinone oxidoreductase subunit N
VGTDTVLPVSGPDPLALLPEAILLAGAIAALLTGAFVPRRALWTTRLIAAAALLASASAAAMALTEPARSVYGGSYTLDAATGTVRIIVALAALMVIALGGDEIAGTERESETCSLILLAALGSVVLAGTSDLLVLAVAFLLASIPLYALIGLSRSKEGAEAALKTYLLGAFTGISLLLGATLLYGLAGTTLYRGLADALREAPAPVLAVGVVGVLAGLLFKAGAVPAHFWVPDAAQGANVTGAAFATTVPKIGGVLAAFRLMDALPTTLAWPLLIGLVSAVTMTLGNLAAYTQTDPRRLLGWSTVSQSGYLLMPVAVAQSAPLALPALLVYLAGYAASNLAAFAVVASSPDRDDLAAYLGLSSARPWRTAALVTALLSLVGTPPTAVFLGKLTVFTAAWDGGFWWLTVLAAVNTVISLFYYLRWIGPAFRAASPNTPGAGAFPARPWASTTAVAGAGALLAIGIGAGLVWAAVQGGPHG